MKPAEINLPYDKWASIWNFTLQLNVISLSWLTQEAAKYFAEKKAGIIINLSSRAAYIGSPDTNYLNYAASKGAVMSLTKTIARAFAKSNVLAYVIAPGLVDTEMTNEFIESNGYEKIIANIPLGEIASPADIANMIAFLATGKARHATGSTFHINGGSYL
jgi:NAD(P)-dependent dehydrogenase (short-subunit alcohol dehydrogenase family)